MVRGASNFERRTAGSAAPFDLLLALTAESEHEVPTLGMPVRLSARQESQTD